MASDVALNLNGFSISKDHADTEAAIYGQGSAHISILNGRIIGMGCVDLSDPDNSVEKITVCSSPGGMTIGINLGDFGTVRENSLSGVDVAVTVGKRSTVEAAAVPQAGRGIIAGDQCLVKSNRLEASGSKASITGGAGFIVRDNTINGNSDAGILVGECCQIKANTVTGNGDFGIGTGDSSIVADNSVTKTKFGLGIELSAEAAS